MRIALLLAAALVLACDGRRHEYDACAVEEREQLRCAVGCPGGGIPCDAAEDLAVQCQVNSWQRLEKCGACAELDEDNAVQCDGVTRALLWAPCGGGADPACSFDGRQLLRCKEGEWRLDTYCDAPKACGRAGTALGCVQ